MKRQNSVLGLFSLERRKLQGDKWGMASHTARAGLDGIAERNSSF